jgi:predicted aspartyl protease
MVTATMGRVVTEATIENLGDLYGVSRGLLMPDKVRRIVVTDALVDIGTTALALPSRIIQELGLTKRYEKRSRSALGTGMISVYDAVRVTIQGRDASVDVMEVPDDVPVLIGQVPLEFMDLVVDLRSQRLIGNPANDGIQTLELY